MTVVSGQGEIGSRFARALGLDPCKTRKIDLHVHLDNVITATVEMYVTKEEMEMLELELIPFELHEIKKEEKEKEK